MSNKKIILISGKAGSGKDTFANFLKIHLESIGKTCRIFHFADKLKWVAREYHGWDGEKDENGRRLLQRIGDNYLQHVSRLYWVEEVKTNIRFIDEEYIIIPDCRYKAEFDYFESATKILVVREDNPLALSSSLAAHQSENDLEGQVFDYLIKNNSDHLPLYVKAVDVADSLSHPIAKHIV